MKRRTDILVKCPYYKEEERQIIFCEGVRDGSSIHLAFDTDRNLKEYKNCFCKGIYNSCLIAQMLNRKWDYEV